MNGLTSPGGQAANRCLAPRVCPKSQFSAWPPRQHASGWLRWAGSPAGRFFRRLGSCCSWCYGLSGAGGSGWWRICAAGDRRTESAFVRLGWNFAPFAGSVPGRCSKTPNHFQCYSIINEVLSKIC